MTNTTCPECHQGLAPGKPGSYRRRVTPGCSVIAHYVPCDNPNHGTFLAAGVLCTCASQ